MWTPANADKPTVSFKGSFTVAWYDAKAKVSGSLTVNTSELTVQVAKIHKSYGKANPDGKSGLGDPTSKTINPADLTFTVEIARKVNKKILPNHMSDLRDKLPEEAGWCKMAPGAQDYTANDIQAAAETPRTCPHCGRQTLQRVTYTPSLSATAPAITIGMPTWKNSNEAGSWAQQERAKFVAALAKHEANHEEKFKKHCADAKALIEAFAKKRFVDEDCRDAQAAEAEAGKAYDSAKAELDAALATMATAIAEEEKKHTTKPPSMARRRASSSMDRSRLSATCRRNEILHHAPSLAARDCFRHHPFHSATRR